MIRTEKGFAKFEKTDPIVDEVYFNAYDTLATVNAVIYILTAVVLNLLVFALVFCQNRLTFDCSINGRLLGMPLMFLGLSTLVIAIFFYYSLAKGKKSLYTRVVPFYGAMVVASLFAGLLMKDEDGDQWRIPAINLDNMNANTAIFGCAFVLTSVALFTSWINSGLRTDRLKFLGTPFLAFVVVCCCFAYAMIFTTAAANSVAQRVDGSSALRSAAYFGIVAGLFMALAVSDEIASRLVRLLMGGDDYVAAAPELANATSRSKQAFALVVALAVLIPAVTTWSLRGGLVEDERDSRWDLLLPLFLGFVPVVLFLAAAAMQLRLGLPETYYTISNVMMAAIFFVVGTMVFPWNMYSLLLALGLLIILGMMFMFSQDIGSNLSISMLVGALFCLIKYLSATNIEDGADDKRKLVIYGLPLIAFTLIWFVRSYVVGGDYGLPMTLGAFTFSYLLFFFDEATDKDALPADDYRAIGTDFVFVTTVLLLINAGTMFVGTQVVNFQVQSQIKLPIIATVFKAMLALVLGYAGSYVYTLLRTDQRVAEFFRSAQAPVSDGLDCLVQDLQKLNLFN